MARSQPSLFEDSSEPEILSHPKSLESDLREFQWEGKPTAVLATAVEVDGRSLSVKTFVNEF